ncbi:hypothetical protein Nepgr_011285 [Nepenthes gracilis]|uniref:Uncharacterized protein n=1 Tax=Nepenthes gracilis TaxID=150966 RepID=A0AAD3SEM0_NEPGR|nr:hypothetical protein Nepgr_011285 [Nepenthes gracilis]
MLCKYIRRRCKTLEFLAHPFWCGNATTKFDVFEATFSIKTNPSLHRNLLQLEGADYYFEIETRNNILDAHGTSGVAREMSRIYFQTIDWALGAILILPFGLLW